MAHPMGALGAQLAGSVLDFGLMATPHLFEDISARLSEVLAASPAKDLEKNLRAALAAFFSRLDLVSREEFDVQASLLERARERLAQLEARLAELEKARPPQQS